MWRPQSSVGSKKKCSEKVWFRKQYLNEKVQHSTSCLIQRARQLCSRACRDDPLHIAQPRCPFVSKVFIQHDSPFISKRITAALKIVRLKIQYVCLNALYS